jgi:hypothetical protein
VNHELDEAATDPYVNSNPAYIGDDNDHLAWAVATGGEIGDMCEYNADSNYTPPGSTYMVQRTWSNKAAKAGQNPCVPVPPTGPYFNSLPVLTDMVQINATGSPQPTLGVTIPVGQTKTIDVQLVSDGATAGPWTVTAWDLNDYLGAGKPFLKVSLDKSQGSNGDTLKLTITSLKADNQDVSAIFVLQSDLVFGDGGADGIGGFDGQENLFFGAVGK